MASKKRQRQRARNRRPKFDMATRSGKWGDTGTGGAAVPVNKGGDFGRGPTRNLPSYYPGPKTTSSRPIKTPSRPLSDYKIPKKHGSTPGEHVPLRPRTIPATTSPDFPGDYMRFPPGNKHTQPPKTRRGPLPPIGRTKRSLFRGHGKKIVGLGLGAIVTGAMMGNSKTSARRQGVQNPGKGIYGH